MAKGKVVENETEKKVNINQLTNSLVKKLNKDGQIAWNLESADVLDVNQWLHTGSTLLDYAISNRRDGGIPVGKISEISGLRGTGKSLLAFHLTKSTQKLGGVVFYIDSERALGREFMERQGVDLKRCVYLIPNTVEESFSLIEKIIINTREKVPTNVPITVIWDSIAATKCQAEVEGEYDPNSRIGLKAKSMALGLRKLVNTIGHEQITLICTNHLMDNIGEMFGDKFKTPGGHALDFYSSVLVRLEKVGGKVKDGKEVIGEGVKATVTKTRFGPNYRSVRFNNMYDFGPDDESSWYVYLHEVGAIKKSAGWSTVVIDGKEEKFQHSSWKLKLKEDKFKQGVLDLLDSHLVKQYKTADDVQVIDAITEE